MKNIKIKGFTLAEVLITLAIIGVVAALTIPTVVAKYQKTQYYTQFMKVYSTISNVIALAEAQNGSFDTWGLTNVNIEQDKEIFQNTLMPYFKNAKICNSSEDCGITDTAPTIKPINTTGELPYKNYFWSDNCILFITGDGTLIYLKYNNSTPQHIDFIFDLNGTSKGPNTAGRDIFGLTYYKLNDKNLLAGNGGKWYQLVQEENGVEKYIANPVQEIMKNVECSTAKTSVGLDCSTLLLLERKMNY